MTIGEKIKQIRRSKDMTQEALALALGYTKSFISYVESNERRLSDLDLGRVAHILGVSVSDLESSFSINTQDYEFIEHRMEKISKEMAESLERITETLGDLVNITEKVWANLGEKVYDPNEFKPRRSQDWNWLGVALLLIVPVALTLAFIL